MSQEPTPIETAQPVYPSNANVAAPVANDEEVDSSGEVDAESTDVE